MTTTIIIAMFGACVFLLLRPAAKPNRIWPERIEIIGKTTALFGLQGWARPEDPKNGDGYIVKVDGYRCEFHCYKHEVKFI